MAFSTNGPKGLSCDINVTPLIDVLLVLLIIFMVIVPVASRGLDATVPNASRSSVTSDQSPLLLQVTGDEDGAVYRLDGVQIERGEISERLKSAFAPRAERQLLIQGDTTLGFRTIADLIDAGKVAGADTVGLVTAGSSR